MIKNEFAELFIEFLVELGKLIKKVVQSKLFYVGCVT